MSPPYPPFNPNYSSAPPTQRFPPPPTPPGQRPGPAPPRQAKFPHPSPPAVDPRGQTPSRVPQKASPPYAALARNDKVRVNIQGRGWAIGTIIGVLHAFETYAGLRYNVEFLLPDGETSQTEYFSADDVKPRSSRD